MKINISNDCDELVIKASNQVYCKLIVNTDDNISINYSYNYNLSREINSYLFDVIESLLKSTPLVKSFNKNKNHFNVLLNDFYNDKSIENNINSNLIADLNNKITHAKNRLEEIDSLILDYKRLICEFEQEGDKIDNYIYNLLGAVESLKIVNI
jgi:predicted ribosome quality control (RQC) complex YloA/Tae2 family protein